MHKHNTSRPQSRLIPAHVIVMRDSRTAYARCVRCQVEIASLCGGRGVEVINRWSEMCSRPDISWNCVATEGDVLLAVRAFGLWDKTWIFAIACFHEPVERWTADFRSSTQARAQCKKTVKILQHDRVNNAVYSQVFYWYDRLQRILRVHKCWLHRTVSTSWRHLSWPVACSRTNWRWSIVCIVCIVITPTTLCRNEASVCKTIDDRMCKALKGTIIPDPKMRILLSGQRSLLTAFFIGDWMLNSLFHTCLRFLSKSSWIWW